MEASQIEQVTFAAGETLFSENESSFHFFIIQEGEVEVFKQGDDGQPIVLARVGPGNSLGEFAMLDQQPRSASARAMTDLVCARVSAEAYQQLLNELPDWAVSVMRALVERLRNTNDIVRRAQLNDNIQTSVQKELESAEFSDTAIRRQKAAAGDGTGGEADGTVTDVDFDFSSLSQSSEPKPKAAKKG